MAVSSLNCSPSVRRVADHLHIFASKPCWSIGSGPAIPRSSSPAGRHRPKTVLDAGSYALPARPLPHALDGVECNRCALVDRRCAGRSFCRARGRWPTSFPERFGLKSWTTSRKNKGMTLCLAFLLPLGAKVSQQVMYAESRENGECPEIRQQKKSVLPQIDLLARSDRQAIHDVRHWSGCIAGGRP
jgi:hypothetical protein